MTVMLTVCYIKDNQVKCITIPKQRLACESAASKNRNLPSKESDFFVKMVLGKTGAHFKNMQSVSHRWLQLASKFRMFLFIQFSVLLTLFCVCVLDPCFVV